MFCNRIHNEKHLRLNERKLGYCAKMKMPIHLENRHNEVVELLDKGIFPNECELCKNAEEEGIKSWRQQGNDFHQKHNIHRIEVTLDNTCNLACGYCYANLSSVWEVEAKNTPKKFENLIAINAKPDNASTEESFNHIYAAVRQGAINAKNVERVELVILGGEPFFGAFFKNNNLSPLIDEYYKLTTNHNTQFMINIFTNCNTPKNMIDKYVKQIESIKDKYKTKDIYIMISISNESTNNTSEMIRYGSKWENFKHNLDKFFNSKVDRIQFHMTVCSLSITKTKEYLQYVNHMHNKYPQKKIAVTLSQIYEPKGFSISLLDESFKKYLTDAKKYAESTNLLFEGLTFDELISSIGKNKDKKHLLQDYVEYYKEVRNVDLEIIEPGLHTYLYS